MTYFRVNPVLLPTVKNESNNLSASRYFPSQEELEAWKQKNEQRKWEQEFQKTPGKLIAQSTTIAKGVDPVTRLPMSDYQARSIDELGTCVIEGQYIGASALLSCVHFDFVVEGLGRIMLKDIRGAQISDEEMNLNGVITISNDELFKDPACEGMCVGNVHKDMAWTRKGLVYADLARKDLVIDLGKKYSITGQYPVLPYSGLRYDIDRADVSEGKKDQWGYYSWPSQGELPRTGMFPYFQKIKDAKANNDYHRLSNVRLFKELFAQKRNWIWQDYRMMGEGMESAMLEVTTNKSKTFGNWVTNPIGSLFSSDKGVVKDIKNAYDWDFIGPMSELNLSEFADFIGALLDYGQFESDDGATAPKSGFIAFSGKPNFTTQNGAYYYSTNYDYTIVGDFRVKDKALFSQVMSQLDELPLSQLAYAFGVDRVMHIGMVDGYLIRYTVEAVKTTQAAKLRDYASELKDAGVFPGIYDFLYMSRMRKAGWPILCFACIPKIFTT